MKEITLNSFKAVNIEITDTEYFNIDLDEKEIEVELTFEPTKLGINKIEVFLHLRYAYDEDIDEEIYERVSLLHIDFVSEIFVPKTTIQKKTNNFYIKVSDFAPLLSMLVSMSRGYLACLTKGLALGSTLLPLFSVDELIANHERVEDGLILLM